MSNMIIAWVIIVIAAVILLIKAPKSACGYIYNVVIGIILAGIFLYPFTEESYEILHCFTLGGGIGAVFGLIFAVTLLFLDDGCAVGFWMFISPILMFIVGFIIIFILGIVGMIQNGDGTQVAVSGMLTWGLVSAIIGGGGSILIVFFDN